MGTDEIIKNNTQQKVTTKRSENFREITQDRVFALVKDGYFVYTIQNEVVDTNQPVDMVAGHFIDEIQVKLSPQMMVKMHDLFGQLIEIYEDIYGEIKTLEQIANEKPDLLKGRLSKL